MFCLYCFIFKGERSPVSSISLGSWLILQIQRLSGNSLFPKRRRVRKVGSNFDVVKQKFEVNNYWLPVNLLSKSKSKMSHGLWHDSTVVPNFSFRFLSKIWETQVHTRDPRLKPVKRFYGDFYTSFLLMYFTFRTSSRHTNDVMSFKRHVFYGVNFFVLLC